jgi:hypothetical protein
LPATSKVKEPNGFSTPELQKSNGIFVYYKKVNKGIHSRSGASEDGVG